MEAEKSEVNAAYDAWWEASKGDWLLPVFEAVDPAKELEELRLNDNFRVENQAWFKFYDEVAKGGGPVLQQLGTTLSLWRKLEKAAAVEKKADDLCSMVAPLERLKCDTDMNEMEMLMDGLDAEYFIDGDIDTKIYRTFERLSEWFQMSQNRHANRVYHIRRKFEASEIHLVVACYPN